jgi:hypothetical protein
MKTRPLFDNKKGTEKPIEIFVALFVILAVALVMLKLFQNQITQKQTELQTVQEEGKQKELYQTALSYCQDKCLQASNNDCSFQSLASLCLAYGTDKINSPDYLDLNSDGKKGLDKTLIPGVGVCEDKVPCHAMLESCCSTQLTATNCQNILTQFWDENQGFDDTQINCTVMNLVEWDDGACPNPEGITWYSQGSPSFEDRSNTAEGYTPGTCS